MSFLIELLQSLFTGFGIFVFATSLFRVKNEKRKMLIEDLTDLASIIAALAASAYLLLWLTDLYKSLQSEEEYYLTITRLTGPYWFGYWIYPICHGIVPQLLWLRKIREIKVVRISIAFLFLFALYIEKIVILITSLHRDYIPSSWSMLPGRFVVLDWLVSLIIFSIAVSLAYLLRSKLTKPNKLS